MSRAIVIGLLAVLAGFGSFYEFRFASRVATAPVHSAAALADARPGQRATAYGRIYLTGRAGMVLYNTVIENCESRMERDSSGNLRSRRRCSDKVIARQLPPFSLVLNDGDQPTIQVSGSYQLEGQMRTIATGGASSERQQGFQGGDSVLVIGTTDAGGLRAETVYGGTREQYLDNTLLLAWGLAALAVVLLGASIGLVWFF